MTHKPWDQDLTPLERPPAPPVTREHQARVQMERRRAPRERMASMEKLLTEMVTVLKKLKRGSCWCAMGTGNPMIRDHSEACQMVQNIFERAHRGELR